MIRVNKTAIIDGNVAYLRVIVSGGCTSSVILQFGRLEPGTGLLLEPAVLGGSWMIAPAYCGKELGTGMFWWYMYIGWCIAAALPALGMYPACELWKKERGLIIN